MGSEELAAGFVRERSRPAAAPAFGSLPLGTRRGYATASSETAALTMLLAGTLLAPAPPDCPSPRIPATCCALASSLPLLLRTSTLVSEEVGFCFDRPARLQRPPDSGRS